MPLHKQNHLGYLHAAMSKMNQQGEYGWGELFLANSCYHNNMEYYVLTANLHFNFIDYIIYE